MNEDLKSNKGNLTQQTPALTHLHRLNMIELYRKKKWQPLPPISTSTLPPPLQAYALFLAKNFIPPQVAEFSERHSPPFNKGGGVQLCCEYQSLCKGVTSKK